MPSRSPTHNPLARVQHLTKRAQLCTRAEFQSMYWGRWRRASAHYLEGHPFCVRCEEAGLVTPATVTDHAIPHRGDDRLFWNAANWQPLCKLCHDRKTATEDGGFGGRAVEHARAPDDLDAAYLEYCASAGGEALQGDPVTDGTHVRNGAGGRPGQAVRRRTKSGRPGSETRTGGVGSKVEGTPITRDRKSVV